MSSGQSSLESNGSGGNTVGSGAPRNDYDGLKQQFEKAMAEVQLLRRQNSDLSRRCDHTVKELDYYRREHRATINQFEVSAQESSTLRIKYGDLVAENQRLEREIQSLTQELNAKQQQELVDCNNPDSINQHYLNALRKYEEVKDDYDALRNRHEDLLSSHSTAMSSLEMTQEDLARCKQQCEELLQERSTISRERNGLKQQCTAAIRQWDIALRERNEYRDALAKLQQQHDDVVKDLAQAMNVRIKASKDLKRLTEERNAAIQEYALTMSERDSVHKEMEKLSDDLSQAKMKSKALEVQNQELIEEKKALSYQVETLKREIQSALHDRDKALKDCNDLREKFGEYTAKEDSIQSFKSRMDFNPYTGGRDNMRKDSPEDSPNTLDLYAKSQKERVDNLDQANQEIDKLRKQIEKLQGELAEAVQEAEVSKRRRDWAFSERDKIVLERESIRTLCDSLRKERDRAVSNLVSAIRDSDDIKKQRNEASKELKELKEKMEAQMEENRVQDYHAINNNQHNHSHDSAIDADLHEWETEYIELDVTAIKEGQPLGVELVGGRDDSNYPNDSAIYVASILPSSFAEGKLRVNDCITRVNNMNCSNCSKRLVIETIRSSPNVCQIVVKRRRVGSRYQYTAHLNTHSHAHHGLQFETGLYISNIAPGSLAAKEGNLAIGDRVLSINNKPVDGLKSPREAMNLVEASLGDFLVITTLKATGGSFEDAFAMRVPTSGLHRHQQHHVEGRHCKMVNSSSQTEERCLTPGYLQNRSYRTIGGKEKNISDLAGDAWGLIRERMHIGRGSGSKEKKHHNVSPQPDPFERERDDAIAELDSVLETELCSIKDNYHVHSPPKRKSDMEHNGGTWPKVRDASMLHSEATATVHHPRKSRPRLADLTPTPPLPLHSAGFRIRNRPHHDGPRPVSDFSPFGTASLKEPSLEYEMAPSDGSLDYAGTGSNGSGAKNVLEYFKKRGPDNADREVHGIQLYARSGLGSFPRYPFPPHPHPHNNAARYPSPTNSGEGIAAYCFPPSPQAFHSYLPSPQDPTYSLTKSRPAMPTSVSPSTHPHHFSDSPAQQAGTFPRKREPRIRIPSNPSVISAGSIDRTSSDRGSPMLPSYYVEVVSPSQEYAEREGVGMQRGDILEFSWTHKPAPGELRKVHIEKFVELGIQISCPKGGGVFVSKVNANSLARQVGLQLGDQLLEVSGINLRNATYSQAANVLQQCGDSITMLVQYSPDKYHESEGSISSGEEDDRSRSGSPTPCNSPTANRKSMILGGGGAVRGTSATSTLTRSQITQAVNTLSRNNQTLRSSEPQSPHEPRYLYIEANKCNNLGISLVGGNAVGIFVHSVQVDSLAHNAGLRTGDQILEYCRFNLRNATAEEAAYELAKPADKISIVAVYNIERYNEVKDKPGDSFFIRALFDRNSRGDSRQGCSDVAELEFHKDDILYVDNTMHNGVPGQWYAWLVNDHGQKAKGGVIPSKYKVEEELRELRRSMGDLEGRSSSSARRSFFKRKKHHRSSSRGSKEIASFSTSNLGWYSDSGTLNEDPVLASYQRVDRLNYPAFRPVVVVGPLSDYVTDRLLQDFPGKFARCIPQIMHCSSTTIEKGMADNMFVDYRKRGSYFECTTITAVKDICDRNSHCILDVSLANVERLHKHQIYPIVLLIKFKSTKQIKDVKDARYPMDKLSAKAAKEMYEYALKLESEYRHNISAVIQVTGVNIAYMCTQIKSAIDDEQSKILWVPSKSI